jgi:acetyl-CoA C-acetyltransferase
MYIISAARTPIGALLGSLQDFSAPSLGAVAITAALQRSGIPGDAVSEVIMGNVLTGGIGQAPARQATLAAGLPASTPAMTINKVCGSGLKAVMVGAQAIANNDADVVIAGGQESMTNAPHAMLNSRKGVKFGSAQMVDLMQWDGLWDPYNNVPMGDAAELCASELQISRQEQDAFTIESYTRAQRAQTNGWFNDEIAPVTQTTRKGEVVISTDDEPTKVVFDKVPTLKPVFKKDGTVTAANSSSIDDGAAAIVLASEQAIQSHGCTPIARIVAQASFAQEPMWFTTSPVQAITKVVAKAGLTLNDIGLFEINEAFAVVALAAIKKLELDPAKVNVHGGAVALGHPIGASGARILTTLLYAMRRHSQRYGLATLCIGGGEASAVVVELL